MSSRFELEQEAEDGLYRDYIKAGNAFKEIRDERLYEPEYDSFKAYVEGRYGIDPSTAYSFIQAAEVAEDLPRGFYLAQRHARLLYRFDSDTRREYAQTISTMSYREAQKWVLEQWQGQATRPARGRKPKPERDAILKDITDASNLLLSLDWNEVQEIIDSLDAVPRKRIRRLFWRLNNRFELMDFSDVTENDES